MRAQAFADASSRYCDVMTLDHDQHNASCANDTKGSWYRRMSGGGAFSGRELPLAPAVGYCAPNLRGFTLMELVMTLAVAGVLTAIALPDFTRFIVRNRIVTEANTFVASLAFARSEAIRRQEPITLCASSDGQTCNSMTWQTGWIVYGATPQGQTVLRAGGPFAEGAVTMLPAPTALPVTITYNANGSSAAVTPISLKFCDLAPRAGDTNGIQVTVAGPGQVASSPQVQTCP